MIPAIPIRYHGDGAIVPIAIATIYSQLVVGDWVYMWGGRVVPVRGPGNVYNTPVICRKNVGLVLMNLILRGNLPPLRFYWWLATFYNVCGGDEPGLSGDK